VLVVGTAGFEPATPCSQSRCADQAAPRPGETATDLRFLLLGGAEAVSIALQHHLTGVLRCRHVGAKATRPGPLLRAASRRRVRAEDPVDLAALLAYSVQVLAAADDPEDLDPAAAALSSPASGSRPPCGRGSPDGQAAGGPPRSGRASAQAWTIQLALGELEAAGLKPPGAKKATAEPAHGNLACRVGSPRRL
jgi:hypothetical protein